MQEELEGGAQRRLRPDSRELVPPLLAFVVVLVLVLEFLRDYSITITSMSTSTMKEAGAST
jgi:hypothetical protein